MKRFLRIAFLALLLLIGILLLNTFRFSSKQLTNVPPAPAVAVSDSAIQRFSRALQIRTVSFTDYALVDTTQFDQFMEFTQQAFPLVHSRLKRETVNRYGLLYEWKGRNASLKPALLMGHYDVVPVIQGTQRMWKRPPFAGTVEGGYLYGRGTLDDKSTVMGLFEAVEHLLRTGFQPERTIYLAFGQDEEASGRRGAQSIARLLKQRRVQLEYVLDEGGTIKTDGLSALPRPVALIGIAEKGYISLVLSARSEGGHSSMPPTQTSIGMIAEAVARLEANPFPERLDGGADLMFDYIGPEMDFGQRLVFANRWLFGPVIKRILAGSNSGSAIMRTTTAPTLFNAGVKDNVLPIDASATINFRILPGETAESVQQRVEELIDNPKIAVKPLRSLNGNPSPISPPDAPAFERLNRTIRSVFPEVIVTPFLMLGGTDSRFYAGLTPNVYRFAPTRMDEASLATVHGTNERISVRNYREMVRFYAALIRNSQ
ncbi:M20 family peptidase [Tellurirhabdus rosea]|uniref:M20 family peptidase n=1 Tax=Tellurirhabdus rosea TaxID=2674997 RepID=UPI0022574D97|nr:M20 family peptidase [Tellurirhabdus rosea]